MSKLITTYVYYRHYAKPKSIDDLIVDNYNYRTDSVPDTHRVEMLGEQSKFECLNWCDEMGLEFVKHVVNN